MSQGIGNFSGLANDRGQWPLRPVTIWKIHNFKLFYLFAF